MYQSPLSEEARANNLKHRAENTSSSIAKVSPGLASDGIVRQVPLETGSRFIQDSGPISIEKLRFQSNWILQQLLESLGVPAEC